MGERVGTPSRYQNIFFYYRGPSTRVSPSLTERAVERQIEDNATKALINLLEYSSPDLTVSFLADLVDRKSAELARGEFAYFLQPTTKLSGHVATQRYLVGVSILGTLHDELEDQSELVNGGSRPDAAIYLRNDLLVALEVKVGSGVLDEKQMTRHAAKCRVGSRDAWRLIRWEQVYDWAAREAAAPSDDEVTRFLLRQFVEYLELTGLAPFTGIREADFEFFEHPTWEQQPQVKAKLDGLWQHVRAHLGPATLAELGEIRVAALGLSRKAYALSGWGRPKEEVNLTIGLDAHELQLNVCGWLQHQQRRLEAWLRSEAGQRNLADLEGFTLVIHRRIPSNIAKRGEEGVRPYFQREGDPEELGQVEAREASVDWLDKQLRKTDPPHDWYKPGIHLRRVWPRHAVVAARARIGEEIADEITRLLPVLHQSNNTTRD